MNNDIKKLCDNIQLLIFDVDGVLTDGKITISSNGEESKSFCIEDGTGAALARFAKLPIAFLSGRYSKSTEIRAKELKINYCIQGHLDKKNKLIDLSKKLNIPLENIAFVGDGLVDVPVLDMVGFPISVPNAHPLVQEKASYITQCKGGDGVLSEIVEIILRNQKKYDNVMEIMKKKIYQ